MKAIKFKEAANIGTLYNAGEIAGFDDELADDLIERGIAEPVKVKETAEEKKAREAAEKDAADKAAAEKAAADKEAADKAAAEKAAAKA